MQALHKIVDTEIPLIVGAGRTDSGVHAINFIAHFESTILDIQDVTYKINKFLPSDIVLHRIKNIVHDFHARYSAVSRTYEYWINFTKDPFLINRSFYYSNPI